jgi:hypothetical protein
MSTDFELLHRFGAERPSPDTVAIAAFPVASLTAGTMIWACVWVDARICEGRGGVITPRDLAEWR